MKKSELEKIRRDVLYKALDAAGPITNSELARLLGMDLRLLRSALRDLRDHGRAESVKFGRLTVWATVDDNLMYGWV